MMRKMECQKLDMADHNSSPIGTNYGHDCQSRAPNHGPKQIPEQEKHSINRYTNLTFNGKLPNLPKPIITKTKPYTVHLVTNFYYKTRQHLALIII